LTDLVNTNHSLVLVGFMGSGKTAVGKRLAKQRQYSFIDTDCWIEDNERQTVAEIFAEHGEERFRQLETECLRVLLTERNEKLIIATGGGMPVNAKNRLLLMRLGMVVYLQTGVEAIYERVKNSNTRPLLKTADPQVTIAALMEEREPIYRAVADCVIETEGKTILQIVREIEGYARVGAHEPTNCL
jgi:shikimate kinase